MELQPRTRELLLALLGNDLEGFARIRVRVGDGELDQNTSAFMDEYFVRKLTCSETFNPGLDWNGARSVIEDLLWDIKCGRPPGVAHALTSRSQSESDIAWTTGTSIVLGSIIPLFSALFLLGPDPWTFPVVYLFVLLFCPLSAGALASALSLERRPTHRTVLFVLLGLNAAVSWLGFATFGIGASL